MLLVVKWYTAKLCTSPVEMEQVKDHPLIDELSRLKYELSMLSPLLDFKTGITEFDWPSPICLKSDLFIQAVHLFVVYMRCKMLYLGLIQITLFI